MITLSRSPIAQLWITWLRIWLTGVIIARIKRLFEYKPGNYALTFCCLPSVTPMYTLEMSHLGL